MTMDCPDCGSDMDVDEETDEKTVYQCPDCGRIQGRRKISQEQIINL